VDKNNKMPIRARRTSSRCNHGLWSPQKWILDSSENAQRRPEDGRAQIAAAVDFILK
jgi:hypothetical protein